MSETFQVDVQSEVGRLTGVVLHRPGPEVANMTPETAERALYSDILNLDVARELDLDIASEFLLIAATLIQLKARRLLPDDSDLDLDEELRPREAGDDHQRRGRRRLADRRGQRRTLHRRQGEGRVDPGQLCDGHLPGGGRDPHGAVDCQ